LTKLDAKLHATFSFGHGAYGDNDDTLSNVRSKNYQGSEKPGFLKQQNPLALGLLDFFI